MDKSNFTYFNIFIFIVIIILIIYLYIIFIRESFYFFPNKIIRHYPNNYNMQYEDHFIGETNGWLIYNKIKRKKLIIFSHGNAGNISTRILIIKKMLNIFPETDIFIYDYPEFGLSQGKLNIKSILNSSYDVYIYWSKYYDHITLLGESIGAGVNAELFDLLCKKNIVNMPKMIIHFNGLTSLHEVVKSTLPTFISIFIVPWLNELDCKKIYLKNINKIQKLLFIHTPKDEIINIDFVYKLINDIDKNKNIKFIKIDGSHNYSIINDDCEQQITNIYCN